MRLFLSILIGISIAACSTSKKQSNKEADSPTPAIEETATTAEPQKPEKVSNEEKSIWTKRNTADLPDLEKRIDPSNFDLYHCEYSTLMNTLEGKSVTLKLPTLDGFMTFELQNSNAMSEELAAKFPQIKSYKGKSLDNKYTIRFDTNDDGIFAEINGPNGKSLISPLLKGNKTFYAVYNETAITPAPRDKSFE